MTVYEKIQTLCRENGFEMYELVKGKIPGLKVTSSALTGWKRGAIPNAKRLKPIADYFGVDVSYFYDDDPSPPTEMVQQKKAPAEADAKKEEKEIAEKWDRLSELVQQIPEDKREEFVQLLEIALKMQGLL